METTYVYQAGKYFDGFTVPNGTEFIVTCEMLHGNKVKTVVERRKVEGESYAFGSAESYYVAAQK